MSFTKYIATLGTETVRTTGTIWQWHVGRYNSTSDQRLRKDGTLGGRAENSSTAPFLTDADFHRYEEFNLLEFGSGHAQPQQYNPNGSRL